MPDSLLTTKRKFYKFLDQFSAPSSTSTSTSRKRPLSTISVSGNSDANGRAQPLDLEARLAERVAKRVRASSSSVSLASYRARLANPPPALKKAANNPASAQRSIGGKDTGAVGDGTKTAGASTVRRVGVEGSTEQNAQPAFSPWSHDSFLARLSTFAPVTEWLPKPDERVGEVEWSKRGWSCVAAETAGCRACGNRVVVDFRGPKFDNRGQVRLPGTADEIEKQGGFGSADVEVDMDREGNTETVQDDEVDELAFEEAFERGLVEKYAALIVDGHTESCLWRRTGCKDDIYRLPVVRSAWWQEQVKTSYKSAISISDELANIDLKAVADGNPTLEVLLRDLPATFLNTDMEDDSTEAAESAADTGVKGKALQLALTGWRATTESSTQLLTCSACFQRIGLWMYQKAKDDITPRKSAKHESEVADDDCADMDEDEDEDRSTLDLITQHREHCPWRSADSQHAMGDYAGWPAWRILWDVVGRYAAEQRRRSRDRYGFVERDVEDGQADEAEPQADYGGQEDVGVHPEERETARGNHDEVAAIPREGRKEWEGREEMARLDRERTLKLRRLRKVLGFKFRMPAGVVGRKTHNSNADAVSGVATGASVTESSGVLVANKQTA